MKGIISAWGKILNGFRPYLQSRSLGSVRSPAQVAVRTWSLSNGRMSISIIVNWRSDTRIERTRSQIQKAGGFSMFVMTQAGVTQIDAFVRQPLPC
jgi:hypothetical protein